MRRLLLAVFLISCSFPLLAAEYLLPVFALSVRGERDLVWSSEVYVTNPGPRPVTVHQGSLIPGAKSSGPQCLPIVQPFLIVPPHTTLLWSSGALGLGVGCPEWAIGGLSFFADEDVLISSRIVNTNADDDRSDTLLHGFGQEVPAIRVKDLPQPGEERLLPAIVWQPNPCGPFEFDTNVFFTNPGDTTVNVTLQAGSDIHGLVIDGNEVGPVFVLSVPPLTALRLRVGGPDAPMLPACFSPTLGTISFTADGPIAVLGSVVDRLSGDARTVVPVPARP